MSIGEVVSEVEWRPAGLVDEVLVAAAVVFPEWRGGGDGGGVDDTAHCLGSLALLQDDAHRVHGRFRVVLVLHAKGDTYYYLYISHRLPI